MEVSGQRHALASLSLREEAPGTHWMRAWVGLCGVEKDIWLQSGIKPRPSIPRCTDLSQIRQVNDMKWSL
jgi:hypothetical protein